MERRGVGGSVLGLKLSQNKVSSGHSGKMRDAKGITKNSASGAATIFRVRMDEYSSDNLTLPTQLIDTKRRTPLSNGGDYRGAVTGSKKRMRDKKRGDDNVTSSGAAKKKYNRMKRVFEQWGGGSSSSPARCATYTTNPQDMVEDIPFVRNPPIPPIYFFSAHPASVCHHMMTTCLGISRVLPFLP